MVLASTCVLLDALNGFHPQKQGLPTTKLAPHCLEAVFPEKAITGLGQRVRYHGNAQPCRL